MTSDAVNDSRHAARPVARNEYRDVAQCLGRAFHDDPLAMHFFPDRTQERFGAFVTFVLKLMQHHSRYLTLDGYSGAAVWQAPSPPEGGALSNLVTAARMAWAAGSAFGRVARMGQETLHWHPHEPHWYLAMLGTIPEAQGRGIGSALLADTLAQCDREGTLAYLESSKESNIPFYERHGFRVDGEISPPDCPTLWAMTRRPQ